MLALPSRICLLHWWIVYTSTTTITITTQGTVAQSRRWLKHWRVYHIPRVSKYLCPNHRYLSANALEVARERLYNSFRSEHDRVNFHRMSIFNLGGHDNDKSNNVSCSSTTETETNSFKQQYD